MPESYPSTLSKSKHQEKMQEIKQKYMTNRRKPSVTTITQPFSSTVDHEFKTNNRPSPNIRVPSSNHSPSPLKNRQMNLLPSNYNQYKSVNNHQSQKFQFSNKYMQTQRNLSRQMYRQNQKPQISPNKKQQKSSTAISTKEYQTNSKFKQRCNYEVTIKSPIKKYDDDENYNKEYEQSKLQRRKELQAMHLQRKNSIKIQKEKNHKSINEIQSILSKIKQHLRHPTL